VSTFVQADILNWDWPVEAFDAVVGIFIQFATPAERPRQIAGMQQGDPAGRPAAAPRLYAEAARIPHRRAVGGRQTCTTAEMLRELFAGWEILERREARGRDRRRHAHAGRSALIDLIARKPAYACAPAHRKTRSMDRRRFSVGPASVDERIDRSSALTSLVSAPTENAVDAGFVAMPRMVSQRHVAGGLEPARPALSVAASRHHVRA
jgi:hypothetical protein